MLPPDASLSVITQGHYVTSLQIPAGYVGSVRDVGLEFSTLTLLTATSLVQYDFAVRGEIALLDTNPPRVLDLSAYIADARAFAWDPYNSNRMFVLYGDTCLVYSIFFAPGDDMRNRTVSTNAVFEVSGELSSAGGCTDLVAHESPLGQGVTTLVAITSASGDGDGLKIAEAMAWGQAADQEAYGIMEGGTCLLPECMTQIGDVALQPLPGAAVAIEHMFRYTEGFYLLTVPGHGVYQYLDTDRGPGGGAPAPTNAAMGPVAVMPLLDPQPPALERALFGASDFLAMQWSNGTLTYDALNNTQHFIVGFSMDIESSNPERLRQSDVTLAINTAVFESIVEFSPTTDILEFFAAYARLYDLDINIDDQRTVRFPRHLLAAPRIVSVRITDTQIEIEFEVDREASSIAATEILSRTSAQENILQRISESDSVEDINDVVKNLTIPADTVTSTPSTGVPPPAPPSPPSPSPPPPPRPPSPPPKTTTDTTALTIGIIAGGAGVGLAAIGGIAYYVVKKVRARKVTNSLQKPLLQERRTKAYLPRIRR